MKKTISSLICSKKTTKIIALCAFLIFSISLHAQDTIHTTAGSVLACPGDLISIPINVVDCNDVGEITLNLDYDPSVLIFQGYVNLHPALSFGTGFVNAFGGQIIYIWFNTSAANVGTGVLIEFQFTYLGGSCILNWDTATSEYKRLNGSIIPALFFDGSVSLLSPPAIVTSQPVNTTIYANTNASFSVAAIYASSYQWQESGDNGFTWNDLIDGGIYSGATTPTLNLTSVPVWMNGYRYRCIISSLCPPNASSWNAILTVNPAIINTRVDSITSCADTLLIPITVTNFIDVATIKLKLDWDPAITNFLGYLL